jgi:hypothetical protein
MGFVTYHRRRDALSARRAYHRYKLMHRPMCISLVVPQLSVGAKNTPSGEVAKVNEEPAMNDTISFPENELAVALSNMMLSEEMELDEMDIEKAMERLEI